MIGTVGPATWWLPEAVPRPLETGRVAGTRGLAPTLEAIWPQARCQQRGDRTGPRAGRGATPLGGRIIPAQECGDQLPVKP